MRVPFMHGCWILPCRPFSYLSCLRRLDFLVRQAIIEEEANAIPPDVIVAGLVCAQNAWLGNQPAII